MTNHTPIPTPTHIQTPRLHQCIWLARLMKILKSNHESGVHHDVKPSLSCSTASTRDAMIYSCDRPSDGFSRQSDNIIIIITRY